MPKRWDIIRKWLYDAEVLILQRARDRYFKYYCSLILLFLTLRMTNEQSNNYRIM